MEFIIVPLIFGVALFLLGVGKFIGGKSLSASCSSTDHIPGLAHDEENCGCKKDDVNFYIDKEDPGFDRVAQLGYPNRKKRFIDKLDFKPDRFK
ncbi:MAG: hypothetical protein D8M58_11860 [Calditrichaeota bacterium]|nr:MAG: hypothetical protein DWQ03_12645 [Calditrichota bacterium]MBL1206091.1 hypothetical protein [Calditrichota bacterium]NOG45917.1 hypothetical protein [Calditrichota bacterium]